MKKLGKYTCQVLLCRNGKNEVIPKEEHGHFYQDDVYIVDVQGEHHRYLIQWFGPRMAGDKVSEYRDYTTLLTGGIFSPREVTRVSV
ncbi:MAG: hypothetical protein ACK55Z_34270 [bacterium]